jgi:hypothetical protein
MPAADPGLSPDTSPLGINLYGKSPESSMGKKREGSRHGNFLQESGVDNYKRFLMSCPAPFVRRNASKSQAPCSLINQAGWEGSI